MVSSKIFAASLIIAIVATAGLTSAYFLTIGAPTPPPTRELVNVIRYVGGVAPNEAPMYAATVEGFFEQNGLIVTHVPLSGTSAAVQAVAADRSGLAFVWGDLLDIVVMRGENPTGPELVSVAAAGFENPVAVIFLKSSGITKPSDLEGKTVGTPFGSLSSRVFNQFLKNQGLEGKVKLENIGFGGLPTALLGKRIDAMVTFDETRASLSIEAAKVGEEVASLKMKDFGLPPIIGGGIVVQRALINSRPDVARAIVNASMNAMYFCVMQPRQCTEDFIKLNPSFEVEATMAELVLDQESYLGWTPSGIGNLKPLQLGCHLPERVQAVIDFAKEAFNVTVEINPTSTYTNEFVQCS